MDHEQFEVLVAAVLTAGVIGASGHNDPSTVASMLTNMRDAVRGTGLIERRSVAFIPKAGR